MKVTISLRSVDSVYLQLFESSSTRKGAIFGQDRAIEFGAFNQKKVVRVGSRHSEYSVTPVRILG